MGITFRLVQARPKASLRIVLEKPLMPSADVRMGHNDDESVVLLSMSMLIPTAWNSLG